ncbi:MAG: NIPSNAP family protein [Alphaproteobacteria bacterium]|nr:NIPSNAP family protein [Alphaproteobacteria bacterium]
MIVETRIYMLQPGTAAAVQKGFEEGLKHRNRFPGFCGYWNTEIGPLNQMIHVWQYDSVTQRDQIRKDAAAAGGWPPKILEHVVDQDVRILIPAPFSPPLGEKKLGNIYEFRTYTYKAGTIPTVVQRWGEMIEKRTKLSPLVGAWYTDVGPLNKWVHVWAYENLNERMRIRAEALKQGIWPPKTGEILLDQQNLIAIPAPFSRLS